jgi:hypothetical protein
LPRRKNLLCVVGNGATGGSVQSHPSATEVKIMTALKMMLSLICIFTLLVNSSSGESSLSAAPNGTKVVVIIAVYISLKQFLK